MLLEAKRNLIEYLERMNHTGELDAAFEAVKVFADHFPANQEIRFMLIELLRAASREDEARKQVEVVAQELESRGDPVSAQRSREQLEEEAEEVEEYVRRPRARRLVFLDTGFAPASPRATTPRSRSWKHAPVRRGRRRRHRRLDPVLAGRTAARSGRVGGTAEEPGEDMPLVDVGAASTVDEGEVARLDDLIEEVATSPGDAVPGEINIMLEPAFESADEDDAAGSGPLEGLEMLTPPEDVEVLDGFVAEEAPELSELLAGDADAAPSLLGEPEVAGELEPVGEMETLEEFAVTEEFADAATDADEFFVADEEPGALAYAAAMASPRKRPCRNWSRSSWRRRSSTAWRRWTNSRASCSRTRRTRNCTAGWARHCCCRERPHGRLTSSSWPSRGTS
jgi:hypothetical protein